MSSFGKRRLHELYYHLRLNRRVEEELVELRRQGKLVGRLPLSSGQEAVNLGIAQGLREQDILSSSLPGTGAWLARGVKPWEVFAHLLGKLHGPSQGRDAWPPGDPTRGLIPPGGHLATHVSVLAGMAYASKLQGKGVVAAALVTEAAVATGDFHEGLNFAAVHRAPLVLVVETSGKRNRRPPSPETTLGGTGADGLRVFERMRGYGVASVMVDGNDVLQILPVMEAATERARSGKGPTFIEARTAGRTRFSTREDVVSLVANDGAEYEENAVRNDEPNDPVEQFESFLLEHGLLKDVARQAVLDEVDKIVKADVNRAERAPHPEPQTLRDGVYT